MRKHLPSASSLLVVLVAMISAPATCSETAPEPMLKKAQSRLRAIYDRNEFRARRFRADWLPDSSKYEVMEAVPDGTERVRVRYDVRSGKRTVLDSPRKPGPGRSGNISPDGRHVLFSEQGNLYVRRRNDGRKILLVRSTAGSSISSGRAAWSPDGKWIAFVQSDDSEVKLRPVLVPGDPTYPKVKEVRFARVGEAIPTLRVGVVDSQGKETRWLPVPIPTEGFYLGQVQWAGNSDELLIEKLSRFRNEREFLLADIPTGAMRRIFHESDPGLGRCQLRQECRADVDSRRAGVRCPERKGRLASRLRLLARR